MSDAAKVAAKWWADTLRAPPLHDTGDMKLSVMMTRLTGFSRPLPEDTVQRFEDGLVELIDKDLARRRTCYLRVDYDPEGNLAEVANTLGVDLKYRLPSKTRMYVSPERISVIAGYGADEEQLWPSTALVEPD